MKNIGIGLFLLVVSVTAYSADQNNIPTDKIRIANGKIHFMENCYACHSISKEKIGPALASVPDKRELSWLKLFIKNSQELITSNDSIAVFLSKSYNRQVMPAFTKLEEDDVLEILAYIKDASLRPDTKDAESIQPDFINQDYIAGKILFDAQCATCHALGYKIIGPALGSIPKTRDRKWLYNFIHNSQQVIASGDKHAVFLYTQFDQTRMPAFEFLSENQINSILDYIETTSESPNYTAGINGLKVKTNPNQQFAMAYSVAKDNDLNNPYKDPITDRNAIRRFFQFMMLFAFVFLTFIITIVGVKAYKVLRKSSSSV